MTSDARQRPPRRATSANGLPANATTTAATTKSVKIDTSKGHVGISCSNSIEPPGVKVDWVDPADLAHRAGLRAGDIILHVNNVAVLDHEATISAVNDTTNKKGVLAIEYMPEAAAKALAAAELSMELVTPTKSAFAAYVLWCVGGVFGLHHFYLGRDSQAFLHMVSFGGFGLGTVRDFFCIPRYARAANEDSQHRRELKGAKFARPTHPPRGVARTLAMLLFGTYFSYMASSLVPRHTDAPWTPHVNLALEVVMQIVGATIGAYIVGVIPPHSGSLKHTAIGSACGGLLLPVLIGSAPSSMWFAIGACIGWRRRVAWAPAGPQRRVRVSAKRRAALIVGGSTLVWGCALCGMYQRLEVAVRTSNGGVQRIRFKDGVHHVLQSPFFRALGSNLRSLVGDIYLIGWRSAFTKAFTSLDLAGEAHACETLGLSSTCLSEADSFSEVKRAHRALVLEYHPDKHGGASPEELERINAKFRSIQEAYEHLSKLHSSRKKARPDAEGE